MPKGRPVLWGARRHDWQIGGAYDRERTRLADGLWRMRRAVLKRVLSW